MPSPVLVAEQAISKGWLIVCKLTWRWEWGGKREQGTGKEKEMVNGLDSTFPQETVRRTTEGREVQAMVGSFIQNVFIETE